MRRSHARLYLPFVALAVAQAAFVLVAPSRGERNVLAGGGDEVGTTAATRRSASRTAAGAATEDDLLDDGLVEGESATGAGPAGEETARGAGPDVTTGEALGGAAPSTATGPVAAAAGPTGSTAHCKAGRQTDVLFNGPPCAPRFSGSNGGATYPGVTATQVKVVYFECQPNEQVNAILATQGLSASRAEVDAMAEATVEWVNKTYELYGRKLVYSHVVGDCPLTPPDPAKMRQAAAEVAKTKPALVYGATGPEAHDIWSQNGILSVGSSNLDNAFYAGRRPFRWDVATSGTEGADQVAEYYCKKLKAKPASNAGVVIHRSIGGRSTPRKLGVIVPDNGNGSMTPNAARVKQKVQECGGGDVPVFTYSSDINRAAEQTRVVVAGLIAAKVTTVVCMCDAIAPVFLTNGLTQNQYFPEHVVPGAGLLDYDVLGRLYDPAQWAHAFGPSQLTNAVPFSQSDAAKVWRAAGRPGEPCSACGVITAYLAFLGLMVQAAGPTFTPANVEKGLVGARYTRGGWGESKGNPNVSLFRFGPGDYTATSDFREVYWEAGATSAIDGKRGAYVPVDGGRRYAIGELGTEFKVPVK